MAMAGEYWRLGEYNPANTLLIFQHDGISYFYQVSPSKSTEIDGVASSLRISPVAEARLLPEEVIEYIYMLRKRDTSLFALLMERPVGNSALEKLLHATEVYDALVNQTEGERQWRSSRVH